MIDEIIDIKVAAKELGIDATTLRRHCKKGHLGRKHGRDWLITRQELEAFRKSRRKPGRPAGDAEMRRG